MNQIKPTLSYSQTETNILCKLIYDYMISGTSHFNTIKCPLMIMFISIFRLYIHITTSHVGMIKDSVWSIHYLWYDEEQIIFDYWVQYSLFESWASTGIVDNFVVSKTPLVIL